MKQFTICCLFYGNHPDLAERLLKSLDRAAWFPHIDIRVGMNNVSDGTRQLVHDAANRMPITDVYVGNSPYYKYPLMRRMFFDHADATLNDPFDNCSSRWAHPMIMSPYTMWFDDDSWVLPTALTCSNSLGESSWLKRVAQKLQTHEMIGAPYFKHLRGMQHQFIEDQPWYNGQPVKHRQKISFITGGWWTIHTRILMQHDWPPDNFEHNGGDVLLGELCRQHNYRLGKFTTGLAINADASEKCSSAKRRGFSQPPIGVDYVRPKPRPVPTLFDVLDGKHAP